MKAYDERVRETIFPVKIVKVFGNVANSELLTKPKTLQIGLGEPDCTVFQNGESGEKAGVLLDFGREINGAARILTYSCHSSGPVKARIVCGESVSEALSRIGSKNSTNDHAIRDMEVVLPSYSDMTFSETGFRFLFFELKGKNSKLTLKSIAAVSIYRDLPYIGTFSCNEPVLNKIYDTCAYTCHLCLQQYIWDGIKRDRLVWAGDIHPEMLTIRTVFGNIPLVRKTLKFMRESTPLPGWMNYYPTYSLWWLIIVKDWYLYSGDEDFLEENREYIVLLVKQLLGIIGEDGTDRLGKYFLDWQTDETEAAEYGSRALLVMALDAASQLCENIKDRDTAAECKRKKDILKSCAWKSYGVKQTSAMLSLAGCQDADISAAEISRGGAKGFSTFMSYYLLKAVAKENLSTALDLLKEYYGGMLSMGATTFWEDFNVEWLKNAAPIDKLREKGQKDIHGDNGEYCYKGFRHSLCHGWSSSPCAFLAEEVLGIHILEAGCKKVEIRPDLGNLSWAKGTFPTPDGIISVSCERDKKGGLSVKWTAPDNIQVLCDY